MTQRYKLKEVLQKENEDNYNSIDIQNSNVTSHKERMLSRIEYAVFGNSDIQFCEFKKLCDRNPKYKTGLYAYKND